MNLLNIKLAVRNLLKSKFYSFLIIGGFAIGFAACMLIVLFYYTETRINHDFKDHKQIFRLYDVKKNRCNLNWDLYPILLNDYAAVEDACPLDYTNSEQFVIKNEKTQLYSGFRHLISTSENFFSLFSVELVESLSGSAFVGKESVAISVPLARSLFGDQNPIGQQVNIGNYFFGTISSLFKELPENSSFSADVIMNSENEKFRMSSTITNGKKYNPTNLFVKLRNGISARDLTDELNKSDNIKQLDVDSLALQSLDDIYLSELTIKSRHAKGNPVLLKIFLALALLILLLSSINYLNYSVSMRYAKLRVTGINKTFGAGWKELAGNTVAEVTIGMLLSLLLALVIIDLAMPYSGILFGKTLHLTGSDLIVIAPAFLVILMVVILVNSVAPIYILSKYNIAESLSGFKGKKNNKQIWKQSLLTFQLTVSMALIATVMIIFKQLHFVGHSDLGFDSELLLRIDLPYRFQQTDALRQELTNLSFVKSTALSSGCPGMINHKFDNDFEGKYVVVNCIYVGDNYLNTMGMKLIGGRDFLDGDMNRACMMNEEAVKQYGWKNIEGKRFNSGQEGGFEVIGLIKDFKFESYYYAVEPLALLFGGTNLVNVLSVRLTPGNTGQQIDQIRKVWKSLSPNEPFSFIFYDNFFQSFYNKEEKMAGSITFFTFIAIVLTCMGILGQIFMICLSKVKEIGIRKINGARVSDVLIMLNKDFSKWIVIAFILSTPVSWFIMHKWLENFAYKTSLSWWIFVITILLTLFITIVTASWQSWRAATRNPVEALRYE